MKNFILFYFFIIPFLGIAGGGNPPPPGAPTPPGLPVNQYDTLLFFVGIILIILYRKKLIKL